MEIGVHFIYLITTAHFLSEACDLVFDTTSRGKQFFIVGTKNKAADLVAWAAIRARCQIGDKYGPWVPIIGTLFLFVFVSNWSSALLP